MSSLSTTLSSAATNFSNQANSLVVKAQKSTMWNDYKVTIKQMFTEQLSTRDNVIKSVAYVAAVVLASTSTLLAAVPVLAFTLYQFSGVYMGEDMSYKVANTTLRRTAVIVTLNVAASILVSTVAPARVATQLATAAISLLVANEVKEKSYGKI